MTQFDYNGYHIIIRKERNIYSYIVTIQKDNKIVKTITDISTLRHAKSRAKDHIGAWLEIDEEVIRPDHPYKMVASAIDPDTWIIKVKE